MATKKLWRRTLYCSNDGLGPFNLQFTFDSYHGDTIEDCNKEYEDRLRWGELRGVKDEFNNGEIREYNYCD